MMVNWNTSDGSAPSGGGVWKWARINSGVVYSGDPVLGETFQAGYNWFYEYYSATTGDWHQYDANYYPVRNGWSRLEMHLKLSNPAGTANGIAKTWMDLHSNTNASNVVTKASGNTNTIYSVLLPGMMSGAAKAYKIYIDDVYIDNTIARVEIGNASTWYACTKREVQIPTLWSDTGTSITITLNQGSFSNLNNAYLYVIDADGNVNENGYPLSDGGGGATPPLPSSSNGSDASASGGSGCGFVKGNDGKGLSFMLMLIITLTAIAIARRFSNRFSYNL